MKATTPIERVNVLLEGTRHRHKMIVSPEGVPLDVRIANRGERLAAFVIDLTFMLVAIFGLLFLLFLLFFTRTNTVVGLTLVLFVAFLVRNLYFLHFELAWQGRTPGKKICGLRVISRDGGELTPGAVIARNLTRELEFFLPFSLFVNLEPGAAAWQQLSLFGWAFAIASLPLFNRDRLRAGDLIGGTMVISMPKRALLGDLAAAPAAETVLTPAYAFSHEQLAVYGAFELQILEEFLRRPPTPEADRLLAEVCEKIRRKIGWEGEVPASEVRRFLQDFYAAERADLERGQLYGRLREDKTAAPQRAPLDGPAAAPAAVETARPADFTAAAPQQAPPLYDPEAAPAADAALPPAYAFLHGQLATYGANELQVLEEVLRRVPSPETDRLLEEICEKIRRKIGWAGDVPAADVRRFLEDFHAAARVDLERTQQYWSSSG